MCLDSDAHMPNHLGGEFVFRGLKAKRSDYTCYANSKLLLMMFCGELQRRLRAAGSTMDCMSAHPGISSTDIFRKQDKSKPTANILDLLGNNVLARIQPPERGCHSMLYAATEPSLTGMHFSACCLPVALHTFCLHVFCFEGVQLMITPCHIVCHAKRPRPFSRQCVTGVFAVC